MKGKVCVKMSSKQKGLYLVIAGIIVLVLKLSFNTGFDLYPAYETSYDINPESQVYTLNYFYGANYEFDEYSATDVYYTGFQINIFSNIIGYILIILGLKKLKDVSKIFSLGVVVAFVGMALYSVVEILPFILNGKILCYIALLLGIAELGATICTLYLFVYGSCMSISGIIFKQERTYIGLSFFGVCVCLIVVAITNWISILNPMVVMIYEMLSVFIIGVFLYNVLKVRDYITKEREIENL